jgi:hypothetical protein
MRFWMMLGVGALMLAAVAVPSGVWGGTIADVNKEMADNAPKSWGDRLVMFVPMDQSGVSGTMAMPFTDLCASGGRLRPINQSAAGIDMGPLPEGNEYTVMIFLRNAAGIDFFKYARKVSVPNCQ